jgi:hypothetical protein
MALFQWFNVFASRVFGFPERTGLGRNNRAGKSNP